MSALPSVVTPSPMWLLSTWNVASVTKKLIYFFFVTYFNLDWSSRTWLVATELDSGSLGFMVAWEPCILWVLSP